MIYDISDNPLPSVDQTISPGGTIVFQIQADCKTGKFLRCSQAENFSVEGRFAGAGEFVDLMNAGLDVGAFDGIKKTFDIRVTCEDVGYTVENAEILVKS